MFGHIGPDCIVRIIVIKESPMVFRAKASIPTAVERAPASFALSSIESDSFAFL
jgi:hypothetical protein